MDRNHEILIRGDGRLEVRCACGAFLLDREDETGVSLPEITALVTAHYLAVSHPERYNGHKDKPRIIEGKA